jgi:hypothetical protein
MAETADAGDIPAEPEKPHYDPANPIDAKNEPSRGGESIEAEQPN